MDPRLSGAAQRGDIQELRNLIAGNPFLFKPAELTGGENPLHIACLAGNHLDFVKEVLHRNPRYAKELNRDGLSPLHIASAHGYLDMVKELLKVDREMCLVKSTDGKTPLYYAIARGKIQVIDLLTGGRWISWISMAATTDEGETCLHVALKYDQVAALVQLMSIVRHLPPFHRYRILKGVDRQGNSILHVAARKQYQHEVLDSLLTNKLRWLDLNALNKHDLTPLDVSESEGGSVETAEFLRNAGAKHAEQLYLLHFGYFFTELDNLFAPIRVQYRYSSPGTREAMLVILLLIAAATFQAAINPPGGVWQDTVLGTSNNNTTDDHSILPHSAGKSVLASVAPDAFTEFMVFNTTGFCISTLLLMILIPARNYLFVIALGALVVTYVACSCMIGADDSDEMFLHLSIYYLIVSLFIIFIIRVRMLHIAIDRILGIPYRIWSRFNFQQSDSHRN